MSKVVALASYRPAPPEQRESSSIATEVMNEIISDPLFSKNIKSIVEGKMAEIITQLYMSQGSNMVDDPFDPIYLYDLKPDLTPDFANLSAYSQIEDISDEIEFDDIWN
jgi:hypothetical protein